MAIAKLAGTWTYEDLFSLPDDGQRYEIIEGELNEMPAPSWDLAVTIVNLLALLIPVIQTLGDRVVTAPLDVVFEKPVPCSLISSCYSPNQRPLARVAVSKAHPIS